MLRIHYLLTYCYPITSHSFIIAFFSTLQREIVLFVTLGVSADTDLSAALCSNSFCILNRERRILKSRYWKGNKHFLYLMEHVVLIQRRDCGNKEAVSLIPLLVFVKIAKACIQ